MDNIQSAFKNKNANIGYIVAGYPSVEHTIEFIDNLDKSVIDLLEIGIPYSDPIADGKVILDAGLEAIENGVNTDTVFEILEKRTSKKPIVFLVYYNLIYAYGLSNFIQRSKKCGIQGFIIPDMPYEESEEMFKLCKKNDLSLIPLISVTSEHRAKKLLTRSSGFIYAIGAIGVTGGEQTPLNRLKHMVGDLKKMSDLPVAVGFGIRTNEDINITREYADGAIVGTSLVELCGKFRGEYLLEEVKELFN
ncbi:tryptophan synthase, alpha subunit [Campylobacter blaseri]|uniref:Tryptophan synthase alpha chain n=1 Tax=Campylobacter blaseri TaxID=2042961 RepID=A0A2P8R2D5_9BACT|nr:tryptophan synthase subunit alpha [Campylobacter blaseri]PSM52665.1 tryptophan synthase subunit alpha [Campylobacter blaseri]PSM54313.1 tryptophan synthase subunit alpha [Campylobacter blaseri]QKF85966.1 tryptophan synthase, alpha subunit [Campylobacter blaseri]